MAIRLNHTIVAARDMNALLPTLTGGDDLTMIAPNGHKFDTRQQYIDFHRQWFATNDDGRLGKAARLGSHRVVTANGFGPRPRRLR